MLDVVYTYKANYSKELEYSLKSLKNIKHNKVYIVGDNPNLGTKYLEPIKSAWHKKLSYIDQINNYYTACLNPDVSEDIMLMNDDFFILSDISHTNYNRGTLEEHINWRRKMDLYSTTLGRTEKLLKRLGYPSLSYELHCPMFVKKSLLKQAIEELIPHISSGRPIFTRSFYGNKFNIESEYSQDFKNPDNYKELSILSTNEKTFMGELGNYIREQLC